jgi:glyceraldehyde-3-phosphate dehydrogenase/erythrose-4-phosphate dehydrogenase
MKIVINSSAASDGCCLFRREKGRKTRSLASTIVHRREVHDLHAEVSAETGSDKLIVNGRAIDVYACMSPRDIPRASCGYIVQSTGAFTTLEKATDHLKASPDRVVITAQ